MNVKAKLDKLEKELNNIGVKPIMKVVGYDYTPTEEDIKNKNIIIAFENQTTKQIKEWSI